VRTYSFEDVDQYEADAVPDLLPVHPRAAAELAAALALEATLYGLPSVLQYAQMCEQAFGTSGTPGSGLNAFVHRPGLAGPGHPEFRVPNVDTLYSNGWLFVAGSAVTIQLPDFGDRYFTLNLLDAHSNASNISIRTHGRGPHRILLATPEWRGDVPCGHSVFRVATPLVWGLLRVQVGDEADTASVRALREQVEVRPHRGEVPQPSWPLVRAKDVESDWVQFFTALDAVVSACGVPIEEVAHVRRFAPFGVGSGTFDCEALPEPVREGARRGYQTAFALVRASRAHLGVEVGGGWTRVSHKGRHGQNYTARAVMNFVGLGANVVEENASFNTYVDRDGRPLDGSRGRYEVRFPAPPEVDHFWSLTLYEAESGQVHDHPAHRYSVGSGTGVRTGADGSVAIAISVEEPEAVENWLPAPTAPFFLVLRCYGPGPELRSGEWVPPGVRRVDGDGDGSR
jgi:hypothetical protein